MPVELTHRTGLDDDLSSRGGEGDREDVRVSNLDRSTLELRGLHLGKCKRVGTGDSALRADRAIGVRTRGR